MSVEQINVVLDSNLSRLNEVTELLEEADISIKNLYISDLVQSGILRLIVNKPDEALKVLKKAGLLASKNTVIAVVISEEAGTLNKAVSVLKRNKIELEYLYSYVDSDEDLESEAIVVLRVGDVKKTLELFEKENVTPKNITEYRYANITGLLENDILSSVVRI